MTTPASDCGVTAGCGACPLGRAGVCGDPGTPAPGSSYFRMFDAPAHDPDPALEVARGMNGQGVPSPGGCPVTVWDGPYSMRCGLGGLVGKCAYHGPFAAPASADGTPDRDPAEPRPADAGCAGGCCTR